MISLRQHIASLVAIFLALAVGIALGGGPFAHGGDDGTDTHDGSSSTEPSSAASSDVDAIRWAEFGQKFATQGAVRIYANGLAGHAVCVLALPGVDPAQIKAVDGQVLAAGGALSGTFTAGPALVDPDQSSTIEQTGASLLTQLADPRLDPGASAYVRMGQLLGLAMATTQQTSVRADPAAITIREALATATLLTSPTDVRLAPLVLIVLPPGDTETASAEKIAPILNGLVNGLTTAAAGVVVIGDQASAQEDGELAGLRAGELAGPVSTVDGVDQPLGLVTAVLALEAVLGGTSGAFGASGKDGPVPLG